MVKIELSHWLRIPDSDWPITLTCNKATPLASTTHKQIEAFCCTTSNDLVVAAGGSSIRVWSGSGCDVNLEPGQGSTDNMNSSDVRGSDDSRIRTKDDIFSIGRKNVTSMLVNDDKLIVACSDGNIRLFDLETVVT